MTVVFFPSALLFSWWTVAGWQTLPFIWQATLWSQQVEKQDTLQKEKYSLNNGHKNLTLGRSNVAFSCKVSPLIFSTAISWEDPKHLASVANVQHKYFCFKLEKCLNGYLLMHVTSGDLEGLMLFRITWSSLQRLLIQLGYYIMCLLIPLIHRYWKGRYAKAEN